MRFYYEMHFLMAFHKIRAIIHISQQEILLLFLLYLVGQMFVVLSVGINR